MMTFDGVEMVEVREAAKIAARTPETIRRWVWSGRLEATRRGNRLLVARRDVEGLVAETPRSDHEAAPSLRAWAAEIRDHRRRGLLGDPTVGTTAADLVLADRTDRDTR